MLYLTALREFQVLDRTKEPGSLGEPLWLDVVAALKGTKFDAFLYSAVVTVLVQRIQHLLRSLQHSKTQRRRDLLSVSMMM